jgi:hypothetical protein
LRERLDKLCCSRRRSSDHALSTSPAPLAASISGSADATGSRIEHEQKTN